MCKIIYNKKESSDPYEEMQKDSTRQYDNVTTRAGIAICRYQPLTLLLPLLILYLTAGEQHVMSKIAPGFLKPVFGKQEHHKRSRTVSHYAYMNSDNATRAITRHNPAS